MAEALERYCVESILRVPPPPVVLTKPLIFRLGMLVMLALVRVKVVAEQLGKTVEETIAPPEVICNTPVV